MEILEQFTILAGFPKELFNLEYPTKVVQELAIETTKVLLPSEVELDRHWGLNPPWSVIKHLYTNAEML
jgi:4,5-DOPA dioxygenase extradiol